MADKPLRVLVVDDSSICRASLAAALEAEGDIEVVGEGEDGFTALGLVQSLKPDVVTMDVQMPGKSGLEAVEQIMSRAPVPILVVTAMPLGDDDHNNVAFTAIENGALDIIAKPSLTDDAAGADLRARIRALSQMPVFQRLEEARIATTPPPPRPSRLELIAVTSGQGGIASVIGLVTHLPAGLSVPVVLYETVPPALVRSYAAHLGRIAKLPVVVADGVRTRPQPGQILFIAGPADLAPTADHLFTTLAAAYGTSLAGVVLGGTGTDGAKGLAAIRAAGGLAFIESTHAERTGDMPRAALGAVPDAERGTTVEIVTQLTRSC